MLKVKAVIFGMLIIVECQNEYLGLQKDFFCFQVRRQIQYFPCT